LQCGVGHLTANRKRKGNLTAKRAGLSFATVVDPAGDLRVTRWDPFDGDRIICNADLQLRRVHPRGVDFHHELVILLEDIGAK